VVVPVPFRLWGAKRLMAVLIMIVGGALASWAIMAELRKSPAERRQVLSKWLAVLACLGFGAVIVISDGPLRIKEHRPHMILTFTGVFIFSIAYCLQILASKHPSLNHRVLKAVAAGVILSVAFGAQADFLRGYVDNRMEELDFMRTELMSSHPLELRNVIVVMPEWGGCLAEPCGPWVGHVTEDNWHLLLPQAYRYALTTVGISPEGKNITFTRERPEKISSESAIIDWKKYALAREATFKYREPTTHF
jgi:hypothetical protein